MPNLYNRLADHVAQSIERGIYQPGDKLPGIRRTSSSEGVSPTTVVAAYRHLETEGYLESRPRSGFYVLPRRTERLAEPAISRPTPQPNPISGQSLVLRLLQNINRPGIVQLGANIPHASYLPNKAVNRALGSISNRDHDWSSRYEIPPGLSRLREQIAKRMASRGCLCHAEEITITAGCHEALFLSLKSVTEPGDVVAVESTTYYGLLQVLEALGLKALEIPTHPREGISVDALADALNEWRVKACVVIPNFSNPLGTLMPEDQRQALVKLIDRHRGLTLIEDDIYGDLSYEPRRPGVLKSLESAGNIIHCASFSKSMSPGLRVGWIVSAPLAERLSYEKFVSSCAVPTANQLAVAHMLSSGKYERHLRTMRSDLRLAMNRLIDRVTQHFPDGTYLTRPNGGLALWLELPEQVDATALSTLALEQNVSIAPGPMFSPTGKYRNCLRLNAAVEWSPRVEQAIKILAAMTRASAATSG
jgi:DNA-binding transcriptional MocR family regulator